LYLISVLAVPISTPATGGKLGKASGASGDFAPFLVRFFAAEGFRLALDNLDDALPAFVVANFLGLLIVRLFFALTPCPTDLVDLLAPLNAPASGSSCRNKEEVMFCGFFAISVVNASVSPHADVARHF
jgi:hypothetical protein